MTEVPEPVLRWAADVVGPGTEVVAVEQLRASSGPWSVRVETDGVETDAVLKCGPSHSWRREYTTELHGLEFAAAHDIPVPRVLGSHLDAQGDDPVALLLERLPGTTMVPRTPNRERLRGLGRAAALLHRIVLEPGPKLPLRERHTSWTDFSTWRRWARRYRAAHGSDRDAVVDEFRTQNPGWSVAAVHGEFADLDHTPLLDEADERISSARRPAARTVFVHGDLWQGNTLWDDDTFVGIIDWETAGAGHPGVDLSCLRWDAALAFGSAADVDEIVAGWEDTMGERATDVPYWDAVAALNTRADMSAFVPSLTEHGRGDLDGATLTQRRDAFLEAALDALALARP